MELDFHLHFNHNTEAARLILKNYDNNPTNLNYRKTYKFVS